MVQVGAEVLLASVDFCTLHPAHQRWLPIGKAIELRAINGTLLAADRINSDVMTHRQFPAFPIYILNDCSLHFRFRESVFFTQKDIQRGIVATLTLL